MGRRGRRGALVFAAVALAAAAVSASAWAGTGTLNLRYTSTTTNWGDLPGREGQSTYDPCFGSERLVGMGGWAGESTMIAPFESQFKLGKVFFVSLRPENQYAGPPNPDSTHEVLDNLFKQSNSIDLGEATICATSAGTPEYPKETKRAKADERTTVKVDCPNGTAVLSGGGSVSGPFKKQRLVGTIPFDDNLDIDTTPDDGWKAIVDNVGRRDRRAKAYAICGNIASLNYVSSNFEVVEHSRRNYQLACPGGQYVLGGGVTPGVDFGKAKLVASRFRPAASPSVWISEVDNLSNADRVGTVHAICHT